MTHIAAWLTIHPILGHRWYCTIAYWPIADVLLVVHIHHTRGIPIATATSVHIAVLAHSLLFAITRDLAPFIILFVIVLLVARRNSALHCHPLTCAIWDRPTHNERTSSYWRICVWLMLYSDRVLIALPRPTVPTLTLRLSAG